MTPVTGMAASALLLGEPLGAWKLAAFALVLGLGGVGAHAVGARK